MRLDQFLQKTGIIKRRSLAKEFCERGAVELNGKRAKAAHEVSPQDAITVKFPDRRCTYSIREIPQGNVSKASRVNYVVLSAEERFHED